MIDGVIAVFLRGELHVAAAERDKASYVLTLSEHSHHGGSQVSARVETY